MNELEGMNVRLILVSNVGLVVVSGKWIKSNEHFAIIETKQGPMYISLYQIKTIQPLKEEMNSYEKR